MRNPIPSESLHQQKIQHIRQQKKVIARLYEKLVLTDDGQVSK